MKDHSKFIQQAVHNPGSLTRSAHRAHMGVQEFAQKHKHDSGKTGYRSRLAITLNRLAKRR